MTAKKRAAMQALADLRAMGVTVSRPSRTDAEVCRVNGWKVGDVLQGAEGESVDSIVLTAIGERNILARQVAHNGKPYSGYELAWTLSARDWKKVAP